ncbi:hypothetical protein ABT255_47905 [Streptomyces mirabilis]|uniref:WXG100-like domain-containing protein n=1 Tax=Streptomyces mirabilis TaxID=68239 RepID=UPI00331AE721
MAVDPTINGVVQALTGMAVPEGDSGRVLGEVMQPNLALVRDLEAFQHVIAQVVIGVSHTATGPWSDAYVQAMSTFASGDGADYVRSLKETASKLADSAHEYAYELDYTNRMIVAQVAMFLFEWALTLVLAVFNPIEALIEQGFLRALFRVILRSTLLRFLAAVAAFETLNVGLGAAMDGLVRWTLSLQGERTSEGGTYRRQSLEFGAMQGALGAFMPFLTGPLSGLLLKGLGRNVARDIEMAVGSALRDRSLADGRATMRKLTERSETLGPTQVHEPGLVPKHGAGFAGPPTGAAGPRDEFARGIGASVAAMAYRLNSSVVEEGYREAFRREVGDTFLNMFGGELGRENAGALGERWANGFLTGWGREDLASRLDAALTGLPASAGTALRVALSSGVARGVRRDYGAKAAHVLAEIPVNAAHQSLSEGFFNLSTTGTFSVQAVTGTAGAVAGVVSHLFTAHARSMGAGLQMKGIMRGFGPLREIAGINRLDALTRSDGVGPVGPVRSDAPLPVALPTTAHRGTDPHTFAGDGADRGGGTSGPGRGFVHTVADGAVGEGSGFDQLDPRSPLESDIGEIFRAPADARPTRVGDTMGMPASPRQPDHGPENGSTPGSGDGVRSPGNDERSATSGGTTFSTAGRSSRSNAEPDPGRSASAARSVFTVLFGQEQHPPADLSGETTSTDSRALPTALPGHERRSPPASANTATTHRDQSQAGPAPLHRMLADPDLPVWVQGKLDKSAGEHLVATPERIAAALDLLAETSGSPVVARLGLSQLAARLAPVMESGQVPGLMGGARQEAVVEPTHSSSAVAGPLESGDPAATSPLMDDSIVHGWLRESALAPWNRRSTLLKQVDVALRAWIDGGRAHPEDLQRNDHELRAISVAIARWEESRRGPSERQSAVTRLAAQIEAEHASVREQLITRSGAHDSTEAGGGPEPETRPEDESPVAISGDVGNSGDPVSVDQQARPGTSDEDLATRSGMPPRVRGLPVGLARAGRFGVGGRIGNLSDVTDRMHGALDEAVRGGGHPEEIITLARERLSRSQEAVGDQEWGDWLAHGGDEVTVRLTDGRVYTVKAALVLPRPDDVRATPTPSGSPEGALAEGEKWGVSWDPEGDTRISSSQSRAVNWKGQVSTSYVLTPLSAIVTPGIAIGGSRARSLGASHLSIGVGRRTTPTGEAVWFEYPEARVEVTVRPDGAGDTRPVVSDPFPVIVGFPMSQVPWVDVRPGDLPTLPETGPALTLPVVRELKSDAQRQLDDAMWTHVTSPEALDLDELRDAVLEGLPADVLERGSDAWLRMRLFLSERNQLRFFTHLAGVGHASEQFAVGGGSVGLTLRMHVLSARKVKGADIETDTWNQQRHVDLPGTTRSAGDGMSLGASLMIGPTFGGGKYGFGVTPKLGMAAGVTQGAETDRGQTLWQKILTKGPTVTYELDVRLVAGLHSDLPAVTGDVSRDGILHVRVLDADVAQFEAALAGPGGLRVPRTPGKADIAAGEAALVPRAVRGGYGAGPGHIELSGAVRAIPQKIMKLIDEGRTDRGLPDLTPLEKHLLVRHLAPDFSLEGLKAQGVRMLSLNGLRRRVVLPDGSRATIVVRARYEPDDLLSTGTRDDTSVTMVRATLHSLSSSHSLSASVSAGIDVTAKFGTTVLGTFGLRGGYAYSRQLAESLSTSDFVFANLGAPLIEGPTRWFAYHAEFEVRVTVDPPPGKTRPVRSPRPKAGAVSGDVTRPTDDPTAPSVRVGAARPAGPALPDDGGEPRPVPAARSDAVRGDMTFWVPERLLFDRSALPAEPPTEISHDPADFPPVAGRERLGPDDMLLPLVVPPDLARELTAMLENIEELADEDRETMVARATDPGHLLTYFQRGTGDGSSQTELLEEKRLRGNRHLVVRIRAELHKPGTVADGLVRSGRLAFRETTPSVTSGKAWSSSHSAAADLGLPVKISTPHTRTIGVSGSLTRGTSSGTAVQHKATVGDMEVSETLDHEHRFADVVYTIEVQSWRDTVFGTARSGRSGLRRIRVPDGLEFLRPAPRTASPGAAGVPETIPARRIMTLGPTRSLEFPGGEGPGRNPLVDAVVDLLRRHVGALRRSPGPDLSLTAESHVVQSLHQTLSPTALLSSIRRLTSTGLRLAPLGPDSEYRILVEGTPVGDFRHQEARAELSVGSYANSFDWAKESHGASRGRSGELSFPGVTSMPGGEFDESHVYSRSSSHDHSASRLGGDTSFDLIMFTPGSQLYAGAMKLSVSIKRTVNPGPVLVNRVLGELPDRVRAAYHRVDDPAVDETRTIDMTQHVAVADALLGTNGPLHDNRRPRTALLTPGTVPSVLHHEFKVRPDIVRNRAVILKGIDDLAVGDMYRSLRQELRAPGGRASALRFTGPQLLAEWGSQAEEALHDLLGSHFLTAFFARTLAEGGYEAPELMRSGGLVNDVHGQLTVSARLYDAKPLDWVHVSHSIDDNRRTRQSAGSGRSGSRGLATDDGPSESIDTRQSVSQSAGVSRGTSHSAASGSTTNTMVGGGDQRERPDQRYLLVRTGVVYTVTLRSANKRYFSYGDRESTFHFRLDDAVELLLHPDEARVRGMEPGRPAPSSDRDQHGTTEGRPLRHADAAGRTDAADPTGHHVTDAEHDSFETGPSDLSVSDRAPSNPDTAGIVFKVMSGEEDHPTVAHPDRATSADPRKGKGRATSDPETEAQTRRFRTFDEPASAEEHASAFAEFGEALTELAHAKKGVVLAKERQERGEGTSSGQERSQAVARHDAAERRVAAAVELLRSLGIDPVALMPQHNRPQSPTAASRRSEWNNRRHEPAAPR